MLNCVTEDFVYESGLGFVDFLLLLRLRFSIFVFVYVNPHVTLAGSSSVYLSKIVKQTECRGNGARFEVLPVVLMKMSIFFRYVTLYIGM
jgi:hypothetical protein